MHRTNTNIFKGEIYMNNKVLGNNFEKESLSVVKSPEKSAFSIKQNNDELLLKNKS